MKIGDEVFVPVIGNPESSCQVIDIKGKYVIVCGPTEMQIAKDEKRKPIGVGFKINLVKMAKTT